MKDIEFNLLEEPWICALTLNGAVQKYTLPEVLAHAHELRRLAGELPTQDFAVLRLLLAVLQTIMYRYDENGEECLLEEDEAGEALTRWKAVWDAGRLPEEVIEAYLKMYKDRFWLFHPERPFYQVPEAKVGTAYDAKKLDGAISESGNKARLFASKSGKGKASLAYDEAARWLLYLNGFDDTSAKPKGKGLPSPGAGWLGKIGIVFAEGDTLFETLMLDLVLLNEQRECWGRPRPIWELEAPRNQERTEIPLPDNQAELLTLQSRRILLKRAQERVTGFSLLGGDFFQKENAFAEQMTFWQVPQKGKRTAPERIPRRNRAEKQMWRDFANLVIAEEEDIRPGIVRWVECLKSKRLIDKKRFIAFRLTAAQYGDKDFFVTDVFGDSVGFHTTLLTEAGTAWRRYIQEEIAACDDAAGKIGYFAGRLQRAAGAGELNFGRINEAKAEFYDRIDVPFRKWLASIDPMQETDPDHARAVWRKQAYDITAALGRALLQEAGEAAFIGRKDENGGYCSAPDEFNRFQYRIGECFHMKNVKEVLHGE